MNPEIVNEKTLRDLEFDRLKGIVKQHASSSLGEEAVDRLSPTVDREAIDRGVAEVGEAIEYLGDRGRFSLGGVRDLVPLLRRAKENAVLDGEKFLDVLQTIDGTLAVRASLAGQSRWPLLAGVAERLTAGGEGFGRSIRRTIDERGAVREDASSKLSELTNRRRTLERRIEEKLRALIDRNPELISEPVITRRRGRLVVPIRSGAVGAMEFVVHDRSGTGQTLYAEPTNLVPDNNVVSELVAEIDVEIRRILRELTDAFVGAEPSFLRDRAILAHVDSLFARGSYAIAHRCAFPQFGKRIVLRDARHPLLSMEGAVPISLSLGRDSRMVVITGPNTGGKTVTLKTIGLLTLMTQSMIPIPASPDSELMIVSKIRSDIGDEQSISQNLSTFSAHMRNIVSLLKEADTETIVLLDELGAGTDPQEGAALGLAVIEALLESEAIVAVSTHLTPLKYFAIRHPEVKTASMEFDVESLSPTYRVIEGIPGRSNAFVIAQQLGLPVDRIDRARSFLSQGEIRADDILDELERERQAMRRHREAAERDRAEGRRMRETYERKLAQFEREKQSALSDRFKGFDRFLRDGQRRLEGILAAANASAPVEETRDGLRDVAALRGESAAQQADAERLVRGRTLPPESIEPGALVHVRSVVVDGRIVQASAQGRVTVDLDGVRVTTGLEDLAAPQGGRPGDLPPSQKKSRRSHPRPSRVPLQLNVRGMTVSEALREIDGYMDRLLRADIRRASILHGKGTGALRDAISAYLGSCSFVSSFGFAPPNLGGDGVTEFELAGEERGN
jgi:DNA mismatch repair protein MutS2